MTTLQRNALARLPLDAAAVEAVYATEFGRNPIVRELAESHERLRAELQGSAELHAESAAALRDAADRMARAVALTDTGSDEFRAAFPEYFQDSLYLGGVPGWRVAERVRAVLPGEG